MSTEGPWLSRQDGYARLIQHLLGPINEDTDKKSHKTEVLPKEVVDFIKSTRSKQTLRSRGCPHFEFDKSLVQQLLDSGESYVLPWAKRLSVAPLEEKSEEQVQTESLTRSEISEAKQLHVVSTAVQALSFRGVSHPVSEELFHLVSKGQCTPPKQGELKNLLRTMDSELTEKVNDALKIRRNLER